MKKSSIFIKMLIAFLSLTLVIIGLIWILQYTLLEPYYFHQTEKTLEIQGEKIFQEVLNIISNKGHLSQEDLEDLFYESQLLGSQITLIHPGGEMLFQSHGGMSHSMMYQRGFFENLTQEEVDRLLQEGYYTKQIINDDQTLMGPSRMNGMGRNQWSQDAILTYFYESGYLLKLRTTIYPLQQGLERTQNFYWWIILGGGLLAVILSFVFSKSLSKPIIKLRNVANEMAKMNFDVQYQGKYQGEIGELGQSLNSLTQRLKETIGALEEELEKEKNLKTLRRELVARVSHELKTPIAIIQGYAEALEDDVVENPQEKEKYLAIIREESQRMDGLLREIIDLSRLESGQEEVKKQSFYLTDLLYHSLEKMKALGPNHHWIFEEDNSLKKRKVYADPKRLEQVVMIFLKNALDHGQGKQITLRVKEESKKGYRVEVYSEGNPLSDEMKAKVWESFYKGDSGQGSGLGLAIAGKLLEAMEMDYGVENEKTGVVFYFKILG